MNIFNILLYSGTLLIVVGFLLFLYCDMKEGEIVRTLSEKQMVIDALLRAQQVQNIRKDIRK